MLLLGAASLFGEAVPTQSDSVLVQVFVVLAGGLLSFAAVRVMRDSRTVRDDAAAMRQALLGYGTQLGLIGRMEEVVTDIRALKESLTEQNGHRKELGQSVSRVVARQDDVEDWIREVAPRVQVPFGSMGTREMMRRERDAG